MKKAFRNSLILGITIIMCLGILCACDKRNDNNENDKNDFPAKMGELYTLQEAYDQGFLTKDDLENIAYYNNGLLDDPKRTPKRPDELSPETLQAIKQTYAYYWDNGRKPSSITINWYYGTYGKYIVIERGSWFPAFGSEEIGGVTFRYFTTAGIDVWTPIG